MRKAIKNKVVQATIQNPDVLDMFHGVLGTAGSEWDLGVVYPKYLAVRRHCRRFLQLLAVLRDSSLMVEGFPAEAQRLARYAADLEMSAAVTFSAPDLAERHPPSPAEKMLGKLFAAAAVTAEESAAFAAAYSRLKTAHAVNAAIVACKNLTPYKWALGGPELAGLSGRFLTHSAGLSFAPLPGLPELNFKHLYISDRLGAGDRSFLLLFLHKLLAVSRDVYDAMTAPDIDVNEFVQVVVASLDDVKRQIPRCDEAFEKIRDSVQLLKNNFRGYYKDFVASDNPTIILENFVLDVSRETGNSARLTGQFRRIISFYRSKAAQMAHDPKLKTLFQHADENMRELERCSRAIGEGGEGGGGPAAAAAPGAPAAGVSGAPAAAADAEAIPSLLRGAEGGEAASAPPERREIEALFAAVAVGQEEERPGGGPGGGPGLGPGGGPSGGLAGRPPAERPPGV
jgi:hypothetical protein